MALLLDIKAIPRARETKIIRDSSGSVKIYVKSPPEQGKANKEIIKFLSQLLQIPQSSLSIVTGLTSSKKRVKIDQALTLEEVMNKLQLDIQKTII